MTRVGDSFSILNRIPTNPPTDKFVNVRLIGQGQAEIVVAIWIQVSNSQPNKIKLMKLKSSISIDQTSTTETQRKCFHLFHYIESRIADDQLS